MSSRSSADGVRPSASGGSAAAAAGSHGSPPRVAVDAMGGDHAPGEIVAGALLAHREGLARAILVGDQARISPLLPAGGALRRAIEVVHAPSAIAMDESPSRAVRRAAETSLGVAIDLVRAGRADAVVSAGNSGAFLAIGHVRLGRIPGIARPAIAAVLPALRGPVILIDAGANVDCRPEWLVQFGVMGSAYARAVLRIAEPRVGIISVGEERAKGNAQVIEAAALLDEAPLRFIGNVEGKDVVNSAADVVVSDGFVGNVMLKLAEGTASLIVEIIRSELTSNGPLVKLGAALILPALRKIRKRTSYETYGGAPLLGLRGPCIVAHGRANREAVRNAIAAAVAEVREDVVGRIERLLAPAAAVDAPRAASSEA